MYVTLTTVETVFLTSLALLVLVGAIFGTVKLHRSYNQENPTREPIDSYRDIGRGLTWVIVTTLTVSGIIIGLDLLF